jgi:hypothetical protein
MFQRSPRGRELFLVNGEVRVFDQLLYSPPQYGPSRYFGGHFLQANSKDTVIRATEDRVVRLKTDTSVDQPIGLWQSDAFHNPLALALCSNSVVVAGQTELKESGDQYEISAQRLDDGTIIWSHQLPAAPVSWGVAINPYGQVFVTLADGRVVAFGGGPSR